MTDKQTEKRECKECGGTSWISTKQGPRCRKCGALRDGTLPGPNDIRV